MHNAVSLVIKDYFYLAARDEKGMTLIKSISGIRGIIGNQPGDGFTPIDIVKFTTAFGRWVINNGKRNQIVIGRDARKSGSMVHHLVVGTLQALGIDVIDLGLSTTPTVEIAVPDTEAGGGIILTASHNPKQWNALKLLNAQGEFLNEEDAKEVLFLSENINFSYAEVNKLGKHILDDSFFEKHIQKILSLPLVDVDAIKNAKFTIVVDAVNSVGGIFVPALLKALGVAIIHELYCNPNGDFPHNPEPLPENLHVLSQHVIKEKANLGIAVDPDVDRVSFVCENGNMFGEEYTLVAVADYVLKNTPGDTVSNLSSSRALRDLTEKAGRTYHASPVGEVNVVKVMKETKAVIGGEGNGGVIYPPLHYGRDALVGIALFLTHLAKYGGTVSSLKKSYPQYYLSKNKITLTPETNIDFLLEEVKHQYHAHPHNTEDGLKIELGERWVHFRGSNTEPIIRIYAEGDSERTAEEIGRAHV